MMRIDFLVIGVILIVIVIAVFVKSDMDNAIKNNNSNTPKNINPIDSDFAFTFLKMENDKDNMIYSPLSIKYALQMLNQGANGNTKAQIESVIGDESLTKYEDIKDILSLANAVYIRDTYSEYVKDEYKNILFDRYNAEIKYDPFESAENINNWIEDKTFGQIKNMLSDELVTDPNNEMFLINALAIDMEWKEKFEAEKTHGNTFYLENGDKMTATTMNKETKSDNVSYYKDDKITAISMDLKEYDNEQMEFIAIMPEKNLPNYIKMLKSDDLNNISNNLISASDTKNGLNVSIPRFSFDYSLKLKEDLKGLGIKDAFDDELADFSNMSSRELFVGGALHKANIDFTEDGVKAAAATVIYMTDKAAIMEKERPIEIKIDKPFMYLIKDKNSGEVWFVGAVYEPNSWEEDKVNYEYR